MANQKFTNYARTTLLVGITAVDVSITVAAGTGALFPALAANEYYYATLLIVASNTKEIVKVTARTTDVMTIVRAQDNTTAIVFSAGDRVELRIVAAAFTGFVPITVITGSAQLPAGTTAQRDASPATGSTRLNTSLGKTETWNGVAWVSSGGATGTGADDVFYENSKIVTGNYTLTTNKNASTVGPLQLNSGVVLTIPSGARLVVL